MIFEINYLKAVSFENFYVYGIICMNFSRVLYFVDGHEMSGKVNFHVLFCYHFIFFKVV